MVNDISVEKSASTSPPLGVSPRSIEAGKLGNVDQKKQREEVLKKLAEKNQGDPTVRKTLTEPPVEYRQPAETAAADDLGEPEAKKERRLKKEASGTKSWKDLVPWL